MGNQPNQHHLILGELEDFLTGTVIADTLDERYRQKIAKKLIFEGRFVKKDIQSNIILEVTAGQKKAAIKVDFLVKYQGRVIALIKFAPGSLVTRRLSTLAISRVIKPYQIPIIVVTNGEDAEVIDGNSGKLIAAGLENLPNKENIKANISSFSFTPIKKKTFEQASRIAFACEIDGACPCDSDVCIIE